MNSSIHNPDKPKRREPAKNPKNKNIWQKDLAHDIASIVDKHPSPQAGNHYTPQLSPTAQRNSDPFLGFDEAVNQHTAEAILSLL